MSDSSSGECDFLGLGVGGHAPSPRALSSDSEDLDFLGAGSPSSTNSDQDAVGELAIVLVDAIAPVAAAADDLAGDSALARCLQGKWTKLGLALDIVVLASLVFDVYENSFRIGFQAGSSDCSKVLPPEMVASDAYGEELHWNDIRSKRAKVTITFLEDRGGRFSLLL
mmetsp:Transcript_159506/g.507746  ORF Transcript_159506/g.507746 Transcript_159506/m.507746 type:complete len:168 (-) Transcript_159506:2382-2885(-)